jgi:flagellin
MGNQLDTTVASTILTDANAQASTVKLAGSKADSYTINLVDATHLSMTDGNGDVQVVAVAATGVQTVNFSQFGVSLKTSSTFDTGAAATALDGDVVKVNAGTSGADFLVSAAAGQYTTNDLVSLATSIDLTTGATGLNINASDISTQAGAQSALSDLDAALNVVNGALGSIGAAQSRIGFALDNTKTAIANFSAAESTIRDVDMAEEMTNFSKDQILSQAGTAMLAQANQSASSVLRLFQ